jgi:hypothetical protein
MSHWAGNINCSGLFDNNGPPVTKLLTHYLNRNSRIIKKRYAQFPICSLKYPSCSELVRCRGDTGRQARGCSVASVRGWWFCLNSPRAAIRWPCAVLLALHCLETGRLQETTEAHLTAWSFQFCTDTKSIDDNTKQKKATWFFPTSCLIPVFIHEWFTLVVQMLRQDCRQP